MSFKITAKHILQSLLIWSLTLLIASCGASTSEGGDFSEDFGGEFGKEEYQGNIEEEFGNEELDGESTETKTEPEAKPADTAKVTLPRAEPIKPDSNTLALTKANTDNCSAVLDIEKKKSNMLRDTINMLKLKLSTLEQDNTELNEKLEAAASMGDTRVVTDAKDPAPNTRVYFRIQISSIKASEGKKVYNGMEYMVENSGGYMRYMYGYFTKKSEAQDALNILERVGVKGAWIVKYVDGKRV